MALALGNAQPLGTIQTDATVSAATTLTFTTGTDFILFECSTQNCRVTFDGTAPTASVGFLLNKDTPYQLEVAHCDAVKVIEVTATASIQWQCFQNLKDTNA